MCRSVPQIEAVLTRTSTSVGPIKGTPTVSICKPFAARTFRNAFIVAGIYLFPRLTQEPDASTSAPRETVVPGPSLRGRHRSRSWWHGHSWLLFVLATLVAAGLSRGFPSLVGHDTSCPL